MVSRVVLTALVFAAMACIVMAKPTPSSTSVLSVSKPKFTHKVTVISSKTKKTDTKTKDNKTAASKKKGSKKSTSAKGIKKTSISSSKGKSTTRKFSSTTKKPTTTKVATKASSASKRASSTTSALKASKTTASGYLTGGLPENIFPDLSGYKLKKTDEINDGLSYFKQQNDGVKLW